jgi:hypothetical protein
MAVSTAALALISEVRTSVFMEPLFSTTECIRFRHPRRRQNL